MSDKNNTKPDDMFVALVTTRVDRHQRRRKGIFFFGIVLATVVSFTGFVLLPGLIFDADIIGIGDVFIGVVFVAICVITAIATESRS
jgi:hypothetical protein